MSFSPGLEGSWVLNNATGFREIYIDAGYTDLRRVIDGLASIIKFNFQPDPYEKDILFFCGDGMAASRGLYGKVTDFFFFTKGLELGGFSWSRTKEETLEITPDKYQGLMKGLEIVSRHPIREVHPQDLL